MRHNAAVQHLSETMDAALQSLQGLEFYPEALGRIFSYHSYQRAFLSVRKWFLRLHLRPMYDISCLSFHFFVMHAHKLSGQKAWHESKIKVGGFFERQKLGTYVEET
jgi:hypothetical protein